MNKPLCLLLAALLALAALPALAEENEDRCVYSVSFGSELPGWNTWAPLLAMEDVESYTAYGRLYEILWEDETLTGFSNTALQEPEGLEDVFCVLAQGELPAPGKVLVSEQFAQEHGVEVGDSLPLTTACAAAELLVGGIYAPDPDAYGDVSALSHIILLCWDDFLRLVDPEETDCLSVDSIVLTDAGRVGSFLETANDLLADASVRMMTLEDASAYYSGDAAAASEGKVLLRGFEGTDLYLGALPEEILVPGGVTMLNVWATFCGYCIDEMPGLKSLNDAYATAGKPFRIVGVCMDVTDGKGNLDEELLVEGQQIVADTGADYLHIIPGPQMYADLVLLISGYPTTFFLNDQGEVVNVSVGYRPEEDWKELIDQILADY